MFEILPNWHPVLVHFSVALLTLSVLLHLLGLVPGKGRVLEELSVVADWTLWLGTLASVATVIAGVFAYNSVTHDEPSHAAMTVHRNWGLVTLATFAVLAVWSAWRRWQGRARGGVVFALLLLAAGAVLASTAWRGGELVYRHGLGVMALPMTESHGDGHDHAHTAPANPEKPGTTGKPAPAGHEGHNHKH